MIRLRGWLSIEHGNVSSLEQLSATVIPVAPFSDESRSPLENNPDALYLQVYRVNGGTVYIIGMKSSGTVEFQYRIDTADWMSL